MMWGGHTHSYEHHIPLFGKYVSKDLFGRGVWGPPGMDEDQQRLNQGAPLLPTGVSHGEEVSIRPLLEAAMGCTAGAEARLVQRVLLIPGAEQEEAGIHRLPIIDTGPRAPQWVWFERRE